MPFLQSYYSAYAQNPRTGVLNLYHPAKSQLSMGDSTKAPPAVGQAAIGVLHLGAPPAPGNEEGTQPRMPPGAHEMLTVDSLCVVPPGAPPINGLGPAVLVFVSGNIQLAGESNKLSFSHALVKTPSLVEHWLWLQSFFLSYLAPFPPTLLTHLFSLSLSLPAGS